MTEPLYKALLIGNSTFPEDPHNLRELEGPRNDVPALRDALADPSAGLFDAINIRTVPERRAAEILLELEGFFQAGTREETLFLYYSGHGVLNQRNQLFLCGRDSRTDFLTSTAVSSSAINAMIDESAAQTTVIILDCCYAGAFKGGDLATSLRGSGRYLLSSCRSSELSHEAEVRNGLSLFTNHLSGGLLSGAVDGDGDGYIDLGDLYRYVHRRMVDENRQIPQHHFSGGGEVVIAQRQAGISTRVLAPVTLPETSAVPAPRPLTHRPRSMRRVVFAGLGMAVATVLLLGVLAIGNQGKSTTLASNDVGGPATLPSPDTPTSTTFPPSTVVPTVPSPVVTSSRPTTPPPTNPQPTNPPPTTARPTNPPPTTPPPTTPPPTNPPPTAPSLNADAIAGNWSGTATDGSFSFTVRVSARTGCALGQVCGSIYVSSAPCTGDMTFIALSSGRYEFTVGNFMPPSTSCTEAPGGEYLTPMPDGSLSYTTNYGPRGTLRRS